MVLTQVKHSASVWLLSDEVETDITYCEAPELRKGLRQGAELIEAQVQFLQLPELAEVRGQTDELVVVGKQLT